MSSRSPGCGSFVGSGLLPGVPRRRLAAVGLGRPRWSSNSGPPKTARSSTSPGYLVSTSLRTAPDLCPRDRPRPIFAAAPPGFGLISTVAGTGTAGFNGDGIPATTTQLDYALSVFVDGAGKIFIVDVYNHRIRKVAGSVTLTVTDSGNGNGTITGTEISCTSTAGAESGDCSLWRWRLGHADGHRV